MQQNKAGGRSGKGGGRRGGKSRGGLLREEAQDRRTRNGMILAPKKIKELSNGGALRGLVAQLDGTDDVKTCQLSPSALGIWHCTASASSWRAPARWHHDSEWETYTEPVTSAPNVLEE
ncbi:unnamed protein product [Prorocentrum cordatum]|uniref:Uncharacterized protein n=1 Tax=Prorocentrum cordatum TaxID=2364126 RepID=A0ABN9W040_9DINO|nr:unnamed protein product [Polarella glacialis]